MVSIIVNLSVRIKTGSGLSLFSFETCFCSCRHLNVNNGNIIMFFSSLQKTRKAGQRARGNKNTHNRSQTHIGDVKLDKTNENGGFNEDVDGKTIKILN